MVLRRRSRRLQSPAQSIQQVVQWALPRHSSLRKEACPGHHSKAAVLNLLDPQLVERGGVVREAQRVE